MADVNANIDVRIDTSKALSDLKNLQRQISQFHSSVSKSSAAAAVAQKSLQNNLINSINAIGTFSAEMRTIKTTSEAFTTSLEKNKFSMGEYFRYAAASTKTFGKIFKSEYDTIGKVAEDRVKKLQTQYIKMGRDASGAMRAIAVIPNELNLGDHATKAQIAAQKQQIFNQLVKQGSTNLLNFGKNTQWAGRQLMVGFTLPLATLGTTASKVFMDMETAAIKFKKVYGDLLTPQSETEAQLENIKQLGVMFTKYGVAVKDTLSLSADAAAAGFKGIDLQRQTTQATRLSILGQVDQQKALQTTISLQNAFRISSEDLSDTINFLNAVENQTVLSIDDLTTAIPKAAPIIRQLGGDVKDLAFFMTAMKEGGINASEGANAIKSGLASIINPSKKANEMLLSMGININNIVESNRGDLKKTVIDFAQALNTLDPLARARAIEQLFGKFQFARISTLFSNITNGGTQAAKVLDLAGESVATLSATAEQELGITASSSMNKFKASVEKLKVALVPLGKMFLDIATPIIDFGTKLLDKFQELPTGVKNAIAKTVLVLAGIGPVVLMTFGLLANGIANMMKGGQFLLNVWKKLTGQTNSLAGGLQYITDEQLQNEAVASALNQAHAKLTQQFNVEAGALRRLKTAYEQALTAAKNFALSNPGMMLPGGMKKFASGGIVHGPGNGTSDSIIARISNGEAIIPAKSVAKNPDLVNALVSGGLPGFAGGTDGQQGTMSRTISIGSRQIDASGISQSKFSVIARRLINLDQLTENELTHLADIVETFIESINGKANQLDTMLKESGSPAISSRAKTYSTSKWNARAAGEGRTVQRQLIEDRPQTGAQEYERAQMIASAAATAMDEAGVSAGRVADAGQIVRGHIVTFSDHELKIASALSFGTDVWDAISQVENQLSNILASNNEDSQRLRSLYLEELNSLNIDDAKKISIQEKITKNMALSEEEYQIQSQILQNMQTKANNNATYAQQLTESFRDYSIGTQAAAEVRAAYPMESAYRTQEEVTRGRGQALLEAVRRGKESLLSREEARFLVDNFAQEFSDAVAEAGQMASPSREIHRRGDETYQGFENAIVSHIDDAKTVGQQLGSATIAGMQQTQSGSAFPTRRVGAQRSVGAPGTQPTLATGVVPQGVSSLPLMSLQRKQELDKKALDDWSKTYDEKQKEEKEAIKNTRNLSSKISAASFAMSSFSGIMMMSGTDTNSALGKFTENIFKASNALMAMSMVSQFLPTGGIKGRFAMAKQAAKMSSYGPSAATGMFGKLAGVIGGRAGLIGSFGRLAVGIGRFIGPWGLAIGAVSAGYTIWKKYNESKEKERRATDGLADAMTITAEKAKNLGEFFGIAPQILPAGSSKLGLGNPTQLSQRQQLLESDFFKKDYIESGTVNAIKNATAGNATLIFKSITTMLRGQGFDDTMVQTFIDTLSAAAGRTDLNFKVKTVTFENLEKSLSATMTKVKTIISQGIVGKQLEKELKTAGRFIGDTFAGLAGQLNSGKVSAEQFTSAMTDINSQFATLDSVSKQIMISQMFVNLDKDVSAAISKVQDLTLQLLLAQAASLGMDITGFLPKDTSTSATHIGGDKNDHTKTSWSLEADPTIRLTLALKERIKAMAAAGKAWADAMGNGDGSGGDGSPGSATDKLTKLQNLTIARYKKELNALKQKRDALKEVNDQLQRQYDFEQKQNELTQQMTEAKISGNYMQAALLNQEKMFNASEYKRTTDELALDKRISDIEQRISNIQAGQRVTKAEAALVKAKIPIPKTSASGGPINGPGTATSDSIPAYLSNGEYVINASSVNKYGKGLFDSLNSQKFANGGQVGFNYADWSSGMGIKSPKAKWSVFNKIIETLFGKSSYEDPNFGTIPVVTNEILSGPGSLSKSVLARYLGGTPAKTLAKNATMSDFIKNFSEKQQKLFWGKLKGKNPMSAVQYARKLAKEQNVSIFRGAGRAVPGEDLSDLAMNSKTFSADLVHLLKYAKGSDPEDVKRLAQLKELVKPYKDTEDIPQGLRAAIVNFFAVHRSSYDDLVKNLIAPDKVQSQLNFGGGSPLEGPGTYFSGNLRLSDARWSDYAGDNLYRMSMTDKAFGAILKGKGYISTDQIAQELVNFGKYKDINKAKKAVSGYENFFMDTKVTDPFIKYLINKGYLGYSDTQGVITNWLVGAKNSGIKLKDFDPASVQSKIGYASGGLIRGLGTATSDSILAGLAGGGSVRVSNGEYVVKAKSVNQYGVKAMDAINQGTASMGGTTVYNDITMTISNPDPAATADLVIKKLQVISNKTNTSNSINTNRRSWS